MNKVTASAPGKLLLFGDHAVVYGHPCIVTAVDQRVYVTVTKKNDEYLEVVAPDVHAETYHKKLSELGKGDIPKSVSFIEHLYKRFVEKFPKMRGDTIETKSEFAATYGFGSSSAVMVTLACAVVSLYELELNQKEIFDLCYQAVLDVQGIGSGFDIASAIWGCTIYYVKPAETVLKLRITELPIIVSYTGIKADTVSLIKEVAKLRDENPGKIERVFNEESEVVNESKVALEAHNWPKVGELMKKNQALLRELNVSSDALENLIYASENAGALGAKLSGAGGGDCMLAVVSHEKKTDIENAISKAGGTI